MKKSIIVLLGFIGTLVLLLGIALVMYINAYNFGARSENTIKAEYKNMENILAQYSNRIAEAAQIPSMQTDDLVKIFNNALPARYGNDGSKAAFQWLQEQNPQLDQSTYLKLQTLIEAGRNKFENTQTRFIDIKRIYETNLDYLVRGFWLRTAGYPKINLDDYDIISNDYATDAFETGIENGLKLRD